MTPELKAKWERNLEVGAGIFLTWEEATEIQAELAAVRGGKVVIPDLVDGEVDMEVKRLAEPLYRSMALPDSEWARGVISGLRRGYELARFRRGAVPGGKVLVDAGELETLRECASVVLEYAPVETWTRNDTALTRAARRIKPFYAQHPGQGGNGGDYA